MHSYKRFWNLYTRLRRPSSIATSSAIAYSSSWTDMIRLWNTRSTKLSSEKVLCTKVGWSRPQKWRSCDLPYLWNCLASWITRTECRPTTILRPCVLEAYSWTQASHCCRSYSYWWRPTKTRARQLLEVFARMHWCERRPSSRCSLKNIYLNIIISWVSIKELSSTIWELWF